MTLDLTDDLTGLRDWTQVRAHVMTGTCAHARHGVLCLYRDDEDVLVVTEEHGTWRARHRRAVHRLGFRPLRTPLLTVWRWQLPRPLLEAHLDGPLLPRGAPTTPDTVRQSRLPFGVQQQLVLDQAVAVLRDVFHLQPGDLRLVPPPEDLDGPGELGWDDDDPEDDWPDDPCAAQGGTR